MISLNFTTNFLLLFFSALSGTNSNPLKEEKLECIADFLVLSPAYQVQTEIIGGQMEIISGNMQIKRAIVRTGEMDDWEVKENELAGWLDKNEAENCFGGIKRENSRLIHSGEHGRLFVKIGQLFDNSKDGRLFVSERRRIRIDYQMDCLANFLAKHVDPEQIVYEEYPRKIAHHRGSDGLMENVDYANGILAKYALKAHPNVVMRWKWTTNSNDPEEGGGGTSSSAAPSIPEKIYKNETDVKIFEELAYCHRLLDNKKRKLDDDGKGQGPYINLQKMLGSFKNDQLFLKTFEKVPHKQLECIADFLVLSPDYPVQTKIIAEKVFFGLTLRTFRIIVPKREMSKWKVKENELAKWLDNVEEAEICLHQNNQFLHSAHGDDDGHERFFKIGELFEASDNGKLVISEKRRKKLDNQMDCLANLLSKNVGYRFIIQEEFPKTISRTVWYNGPEAVQEIANHNAILAKYALEDVDNGGKMVLRWEWKNPNAAGPSTSTALASSDWSKIIEEKLYERETNERIFKELKECHNLLGNRPRKLDEDEQRGPYIKAKKMVETFRHDQFFLKTFPTKYFMKIPPRDLECIADFLVISPDYHVQTEIFAEFTFWGSKVQTRRRIVPKREMQRWKVKESELVLWLGKNEGEKCLQQNRKLLHFDSVGPSSSEKHFRIGQLFDVSENSMLVVSERRRKHIDYQMDCLANFLATYVGQEHIVEEKFPASVVRDDQTIELVNAILRQYALDGHPHVVRRWEWKRGDEGGQMPMGEEESEWSAKIPDMVYQKERNKEAFKELHICYDLLSYKKRKLAIDEQNEPYINAKHMIESFLQDQLFLLTLPTTERLIHEYEPKVNGGKEECCICLEEFEKGDHVQRFSQCSHIFHPGCIEKWLEKKPTCPLCRSSDLLIIPKPDEEPPTVSLQSLLVTPNLRDWRHGWF